MTSLRAPIRPLRALETGIAGAILVLGAVAWVAVLLLGVGFALGLIMSSPSLALMMAVFVVIVLVAKAAIQATFGHRPASGLR